MAGFSAVPTNELGKYFHHISWALGAENSKRVPDASPLPGTVGTKVQPGTIVCLYLDQKDKLLRYWFDDMWSFRFPPEQIIVDLDEELPYMLLHGDLAGEIEVVLGELKDMQGLLLQAYTCTCVVGSVR